MTISLANSMPGVVSPRSSMAPPEAAEPAMEIAHRAPEEEPPGRGQHRIPDQPVQHGHRASLDPAGEAVAHHEVMP